MQMRFSVIHLKDKEQYEITHFKKQSEITNFKNWEKKKYPGHKEGRKEVFGTELTYIEYQNPSTQQIFAMGFDYGSPFFCCYLPNLKRSAFNVLKAKLQDHENKKHWQTSYGGSFTESSEDILSHINFNIDSLIELEKLSVDVSAIFSELSFTEEVLPDVLNEINKSFKEQELHMLTLTESLYEGNAVVYKDIQTALGSCYGAYEEGKVLRRWIDQFIADKRFVNAIMLCHVCPPKHNHYVDAQRIAIEVLMQMQSIYDMNKENERVILPLGENGADLDYLELIYKFASQKAVKSKIKEDSRYAQRVLSELFGNSGLAFSVSDVDLNENNLLIEYARASKKLKEENNKLKFENKYLHSQLNKLEERRSGVNTQGIFKIHSKNISTTALEIRPRSKSFT